MAEEKIGIKLADGRFYPIVDTREPKKRRVILTTASNDQQRAQIDLYRGYDDSMEGAVYVGSVILEELAPAGEEREIELVVGLDTEGTVSARATESASGNYQSLSVSLEAMPEEERLELPDFDEEFEEELDFDTDLIDQELDDEFGGELEVGSDELSVEESVPAPDESTTEEDLFGEEVEEEKKPPRRFSPVALVVYLLLALAALAALTYGVFKLLESEPIPSLRALVPLVIVFSKPRSSAD